MIRVTIELVPYGVETLKRVIATGRIWNDGTGSKTTGNYEFELFGKRGRRVATGAIAGFPRARRTVWRLLADVCREAFR